MSKVLTILVASMSTLSRVLTSSSFGQTVFCTYDFRPYSTCSSSGGIYGISSSIASTIEASQGSDFKNDYIIRCLSSRTEVLDKLKTCECDIGIGDFNEATYNLIRGTNMSISYPYRPEAYGIVTKRRQAPSTVWGLFRPFSAGLWVLVAVTPLLLAVLMTFFSWAISKYKKSSNFSMSLLPQYAFQNTMSFLNEYTHVEYMDWHGRMPYMLILKFLLQSMLVAYGFLCLIVTSVYTAQLTNVILTRDLLQEDASFSNMLRMLGSVNIPPELMPYFQSVYNRDAAVWVPDTTTNFTDQLDLVRDGVTDGVVVTVGAGLWAMKTQNKDCLLEMNQHAYRLMNGQVLVFSGCFDRGGIDQRNQAILEIGQRGILEAQSEAVLGEFYVTHPPPTCSLQNASINIHDLAGAWIILAISVCLPLSATVLRYVFYLAKKCISVYGSIFVVTTPPGSTPAVSDRDSEDIHLDMKTAEAMYSSWKKNDACTIEHRKTHETRLPYDGPGVRLSTESFSKCSKYSDESTHGQTTRESSEYVTTPKKAHALPIVQPANVNITCDHTTCTIVKSHVSPVEQKRSGSPPSLGTTKTENTSSPSLVFRDDLDSTDGTVRSTRQKNV